MSPRTDRQKIGLTTALSEALSPWRKPSTYYPPGKILLAIAIAIAIDGEFRITRSSLVRPSTVKRCLAREQLILDAHPQLSQQALHD
ncbi:hypothetical protein [Rhodococcus qingshengii]